MSHSFTGVASYLSPPCGIGGVKSEQKKDPMKEKQTKEVEDKRTNYYGSMPELPAS